MEHLNELDIRNFALVSEVGEESAALVNRVNSHILSCPECAARVERAARYFDALEAMTIPDFSAADLYLSEYDISPEAVAKEAEYIFAGETEKEYK